MLKLLENGVSSMISRHPKLLFMRKSALFKFVANLPLYLLDYNLFFKHNDFKTKLCERSISSVKNFQIKRPGKQTNSKEMSSIVEDATKTISNLRKLDQQTKNRFQTKLHLENRFFKQKLQGNFFLKRTMPTDLCYYNCDLCH